MPDDMTDGIEEERRKEQDNSRMNDRFDEIVRQVSDEGAKTRAALDDSERRKAEEANLRSEFATIKETLNERLTGQKGLQRQVSCEGARALVAVNETRELQKEQMDKNQPKTNAELQSITSHLRVLQHSVDKLTAEPQQSADQVERIITAFTDVQQQLEGDSQDRQNIMKNLDETMEQMTKLSLTNSSELEGTEPHQVTLRTHWDALVEGVEPGEVLTGLFQREVLTYREMEALQEKSPKTSQVELLLKLLFGTDAASFTVFKDTLRATNQGHMADAIGDNDGAPGVEATHRKLLTTHRETLMENLSDVPSVCDHLLSQGLITHRQQEDITTRRTSSDQIQEFLSVLWKFSPEGFNKFVDILRETEQPYLANLLDISGMDPLNTEDTPLTLEAPPRPLPARMLPERLPSAKLAAIQAALLPPDPTGLSDLLDIPEPGASGASGETDREGADGGDSPSEPPLHERGDSVAEFVNAEEERFMDAQGEPQRFCPVCSLIFNEEDSDQLLLDHVNSHYAPICPVCTIQFQPDYDNGKFQEHVQRHFTPQ